jgi:hypothetical protein
MPVARPFDPAEGRIRPADGGGVDGQHPGFQRGGDAALARAFSVQA